MKGLSIEKSIETLQMLLLSLPECCSFNVISIGHKKFDSFFEKSQKCTRINIEDAIKKAQQITANGGTHLYEALEWVFKYSLPNIPTSIILFSDFETSHIERIIKLIEKQEEKKDLRIFSIGINIAVSHHSIDSIVRAGKGYAEYVSNSEHMDRKAMIMLRNSLNPPIADYKITWTNESNKESQSSNSKFKQVPLKIPELYVGVRFIVYCILAEDVKPCDKVTLESKSKGTLITLDPIPLEGSTIHTLAAKRLIQEIDHGNYYPNHNEKYNREQIVHLAKTYNLSSKYTSFIAVEKPNIEDKEKKKQEIENKKGAELKKENAIESQKKAELQKKQLKDKDKHDKDGSIELDDTVCNELDAIMKDEIPKPEKLKSFFDSLYKQAAKLDDQIEKAITFDKDKHDDHEKAEALIVVEEYATPEKCNEVVSNQKDDGPIELADTVCNDLDAPKEEIITTIQENIKNNKLKSPELPSLLETAINLSYLKKAAPKHEGLWRDKYNKAREYLSKQIGDANAEKELLDCADNYVVENSIKKVIKDKKRNAVAKLRDSTTPEKCNDVVSNQNDDGSFEISETVCKEIDVPVEKVVTEVKKDTKNEKLKSPESEPCWKTGLTLSYLKVAAPDHKKQWEDKDKKLANIFLTKLKILQQKKNY
ncbi:hypothetical protein C2G38_1492983 [Gigaspora rosea]|uniref:VWFA domain-containing protein n=1 Tax=Gigaspora rosea TaxID=44941 RepID=A0A397W560_9GLOM|nr:hypothetical protein C2G38_1492983 [Gigaspora rosea]